MTYVVIAVVFVVLFLTVSIVNAVRKVKNSTYQGSVLGFTYDGDMIIAKFWESNSSGVLVSKNNRYYILESDIIIPIQIFQS